MNISQELTLYIGKCTKDGTVDLYKLAEEISSGTSIKITPDAIERRTIKEEILRRDLLEWSTKIGSPLAGPIELAGFLLMKGVAYSSPLRMPPARSNPLVESYGTCLTSAAINGTLDPVFGRDDEIDECIATLLMRKGNPLLVGDAGVGKRSIVYGVAHRIASGRAPAQLLNRAMYQVYPQRLNIVANVQPAAIAGVLADSTKKEGSILFIDDIHMLISVMPQQTDVMSVLTPYLSSRGITVVGATTPRHYTTLFASRRELDRLFSVMRIEETTPEATTMVLNGVKDAMETYHRITITNAAIEAVVRLARHTHKKRPDSAIELLDSSCVECLKRTGNVDVTRSKNEDEWKDLVATGQFIKASVVGKSEHTIVHTPASVTSGDVEAVVTKITGARIIMDDTAKVAGLEKTLKSKLVSQDKAITELCRLVKTSVVYKDKNKPVGSVLFLGPPGVGKTYLAQLTADVLYDGSYLQVDMSGYSERFTLSRLIGASPGYIGYDEGGLLTNWVNAHPYTLVLLDELEKAHPRVRNIMLSILSDGKLTDMRGTTVDFSNVLFVMTSNIGTSHITNGKPNLGFGGQEIDTDKEVTKDLKMSTSPEFRDRLSGIVIFKKLSKESIKRIIDLEVGKLNKEENGPTIKITNGAKDVMLKKWKSGDGARFVGRALTKHIKEPVASLVIDGKIAPDSTIAAYASKGIIKFK